MSPLKASTDDAFQEIGDSLIRYSFQSGNIRDGSYANEMKVGEKNATKIGDKESQASLNFSSPPLLSKKNESIDSLLRERLTENQRI